MAILASWLTHHLQVEWRAAAHSHAHPDPTRLTALALARAMLAGSPSAAGLAARMRACLDGDAAWYGPLAARCARLPGEHWRRLTPRTLACLIERDIGYQQAFGADHKPKVRRYILRERSGMNPLPLGHTAALERWLGVSGAGMWRLTRACGWQRRAHLGDQHDRYTLQAKRSGGWRLLQVPHPHLPQGAPTSAALANLCAFRLDLRLDGLAQVLGARYTRYADDIVLSGGAHLIDALSRITAWVGRIALEEGFTLNHRKTPCLTSAHRHEPRQLRPAGRSPRPPAGAGVDPRRELSQGPPTTVPRVTCRR
jgi:hypothetical protein